TIGAARNTPAAGGSAARLQWWRKLAINWSRRSQPSRAAGRTKQLAGPPLHQQLPPPRLEAAHFPATDIVAASLSLHPCFRPFVDVAGEEVTALNAVVPVDRRKRRDSAAGSGERILPRPAVAVIEERCGGSAGNSKIVASERAGAQRRNQIDGTGI